MSTFLDGGGQKEPDPLSWVSATSLRAWLFRFLRNCTTPVGTDQAATEASHLPC